MSSAMFSLIVPIYNVESYLPKCIDSLINQSCKCIEILLINDGSTDESLMICENYAIKDQRIRVINKNNGGLSDARNTGLKHSKGEYIIFVDADDYIQLDSCSQFKNIIKVNPDVEIIASNIRCVGNLDKISMYTDIGKIVSGPEFLKIQLLNNKMHMSACRNIYKREFLLKNSMYFKLGIYHEDEQWSPRVFLQASKVIFSDYLFYYHNIRENSITQSKVKTKHALDLISTCRELKNIYLDLEDEELKNLLLNYIVTLYLNAFYVGKLIGKKNKGATDKKFFNGISLSQKNKLKVNLFKFNSYLYYYINRLTKIYSY